MRDIRGNGWPPASFMATLTADQQSDLLTRGGDRRFSRGTTLMHQGEPAGTVAVLIEGLVKIWAISPDGHESLLGLRGRGDLLGEMAFATRSSRSARVAASTRIRARVLTDHEFANYLERWPTAAVQMAAAVVRKLQAANARRAEFQSCDRAQRIAIILEETAARVGLPTPAGLAIGPEVTQADLASLAAVSVSKLEKELFILEQDGVVRRSRRVLIITNPGALRERAGFTSRKPYGDGLAPLI